MFEVERVEKVAGVEKVERVAGVGRVEGRGVVKGLMFDV